MMKKVKDTLIDIRNLEAVNKNIVEKTIYYTGKEH